ncbi:MAG: C39 family peptidase [Patescibacteria group bacterium]|jgi:hypothetical protein
MPEEFNNENLDGQSEAPRPNERGSAITAAKSGSGSGVTGNKVLNKAIDAGKDKALDAATGGAWEAAKRLPVIGKALDNLSNKALKFATKNFLKTFLIANWPTLTTIAIVILLIFFITVPAFGRMSGSNRGMDGKSQPIDASVYSEADAADIKQVLGNSITVPGDPTKWYFNQGDPRWGDKPGQAAGWSSKRNSYAGAACAITSSAMIANYYGVSGITPYILGQYLADTNHSMALDKATWVSYINSKGLNKELAQVPRNLDSVKKEIAAGNPILAQGITAFRATGQHWVVIIGVSKDDKFLVLNDPSAEASRGRPARYSPASELNSGLIKGLWALHDK